MNVLAIASDRFQIIPTAMDFADPTTRARGSCLATHLEVIGEVVLAVARGATEEALRLVAGGGAVGGGRVGVVVIGLLLGSRLVLCSGRHGFNGDVRSMFGGR